MTKTSLGTWSHGFTFLFFFALAVASVSSKDCTYTIFVKTGTVSGSGTNSKISCTFKDAHGSKVDIDNLEDYGKMGSDYNYFESGNLDTFMVETTCMPSPVCLLSLTSDDTGYKSGWYVDYVQILSTNGDNIIFEVYGWLAVDEPPYSLTRVFNRCSLGELMQKSII